MRGWKLGYLEFLTLVLLILKLGGLIAISWWWVFTPLLIALGLAFLIGVQAAHEEYQRLQKAAPRKEAGLNWAKARFSKVARQKNVPKDAIEMMVTSFPRKSWKTLSDIDDPRAVAELQDWVDSL